jgi:hypothetical protein
MLNIFIAVLSLAVGLFVGSAVFGKEESGVSTEAKNPVKEYHPVVDSFIFRYPLTKHMLVEDVLSMECYKFMSYYDVPNRLEIRVSKKYEESLDQLADAIMQWYHPESGCTELLLIAHRDQGAAEGFVIDFTWKKPTQA